MYSLYSHNSRTTFNSQLSTLNFISYTAYSRKYTYIIYYITYSIQCQSQKQKNYTAVKSPDNALFSGIKKFLTKLSVYGIILKEHRLLV